MSCRKLFLAGAAAIAALASAGIAEAGVTRETQAVVDWNVIALRTTAAAPASPPRETRNVAVIQAAVFDAVNSIRHRYQPHRLLVTAPEDASVTAAVASAAHAALVSLYPEQRATLDSAYASSLAGIPDGRTKADGVAVGKAAAAALVALRAGDHSADVVPYMPGSGAGVWIPTLPVFRPALEPGWGLVTPFLLRSGSQFRPGPPPALSSSAYARDLEEVKAIGSAASTTRTPDQTVTARFWTATGPQIWNQGAQQLVIANGFGVAKASRAFALLNMALADAAIAAFDAKYHYNQWRPLTAIRAAESDGNPATSPDPAWTPLLPTPPFPDYLSGHATLAGAAETVLTDVFGPNPRAFSFSSAGVPGAVHTFRSFAAVAREVVDARVWGGIHWRTSDTVGRAVGRRLARYALANGPQPVAP